MPQSWFTIVAAGRWCESLRDNMFVDARAVR